MTINEEIIEIGKKAKIASSKLSNINSKTKQIALKSAAKKIKENIKEIIKINLIDIQNAEKNNLNSAIIDRLKLSDDRILGITNSLNEIADLPEPVGNIIDEWQRPNGLKIQKISVPIGVIGIIYESRPNVTADAS